MGLIEKEELSKNKDNLEEMEKGQTVRENNINTSNSASTLEQVCIFMIGTFLGFIIGYSAHFIN